jgi:DNA-directed RNA polymerase subunit F
MNKTRQLRQTELIELVETHNIMISVNRIINAPNTYDQQRWKRAVYHALSLAHVGDITIRKVREALELP